MHLLVVSPALPFVGVPHAGGHFLLQHLTAVSADADVHLVAPATPENVAGLDRVPPRIRVTLVPVPPERSRPVRWWDARTCGPRPPARIRRAMLPVVQEAAAGADLVELQWSQSGWYGRRLRRDVPRVVYAHDVWTQAEQRRLARADRWFSPGERILLRSLHRRRERAQLAAADAVFVFSGKDAKLIGELGVRSPVHVVAPSLEPPTPSVVTRQPGLVLFTGAMFRAENADACRWLLSEIWPRVLARVPDARLLLAGHDPPHDVREHASQLPGVAVTGWVDDLNDAYAGASIYVAPLRLGAGLKFKVPQAMLHSLPVVSSSVGAEGVQEDAPPGVFAAVTDDAARFADAVIFCLRDPAAASETGQRAQRWAAQQYGFDHSAAGVRAIYSSLVGPHAR